jgi:hypothetical protein
MTGSATDPSPMGGAGAHGVTLTLVDPFPPEVAAGKTVTVRVRASCAARCDLSGGRVRVVSAERVVAEGVLAAPIDTADGAFGADLSVQAPPRAGEWSCAVMIEPLTVRAADHGRTSIEVGCRVLPHGTSLAVWVADSPVQGRPFRVSVGAKCAEGCSLHGQRVEVLDESGAKLAEGTFGDTALAGTSSLYAAEISLAAPEAPGVYERSARFAASELALPHEGAQASFTFRCLEPPEHTVSVRVRLEGIDARKQGIEVRVGRFQAWTDESGVARVAVPKGVHEVTFWRVDLEPTSTRVEVMDDVSVDIVAGPRQVEDLDAKRAWM